MKITDNIKMDLGETGCCGLNSTGFGDNILAGLFEESDEFSG